MLTDNRVREINDYLTASDVFSRVGLKGGCATSSGRETTLAVPRDHALQGLACFLCDTPLLEQGADVLSDSMKACLF